MKRTELQINLKKLGFRLMCDDNKTLSAYNQIQNFLRINKTPIKDITRVYLDDRNDLRVVINNIIDLEAGYNLDFETWLIQ